MELDRAAAQLSEIHAQMLRSEVFRGYRTKPMMLTSLLALLGGLFQTALYEPAGATSYAEFWIAVAFLCGAIAFGDLAFVYFRESRYSQRAKIRAALEQLAPGLSAGAIATVALISGPSAHLLPGLWMILFSLCLFSSRLLLPRAVGLIALFYLLAGAISLLGPATIPSPMLMGLTFASGQLGLALVLHRNRAREEA